MNIKVLLVAGALSLSGHAASAASCNPFFGSFCGSTASASSTASSSVSSSPFAGFLSRMASSRASSAFDRIAQSHPRFTRPNSHAVRRIAHLFPFLTGTPAVVVGGGTGSTGGSGTTGGTDNGTDVAVVPVPAAGFLLLAGLGGFVALRRKK